MALEMAEGTTVTQMYIFPAYVAEISFPASAILLCGSLGFSFGFCLFFLAMAAMLLVGIFTLCLLISSGVLCSPVDLGH